MTQLPEPVRAAIRGVLGAEPTHIRMVGGGMINHGARVEVNGTPYFVKWKANAPPAFFAAEAYGLGLLRDAGVIRVPDVIAHGEATTDAPAHLILEWIDGAARVDQREYGMRFGRALAAQHRISGASFGLDRPNYIGELPQFNTLTTSWAAFYRDQRIAVQVQIARHFGNIPPYREALLNDVMAKIEDVLAGLGNPPSLLHGDLWSGNTFATMDNQPVVVDPAVYYGDREVEIAFTEMFGGMSPYFLAAYREAYPLDAGYEYRRPLLQLYPMLVHLNHFGEQYGSGVDSICRYYVG